MSKKLLTHYCAILAVKNLQESLDYYVGKLKFEETDSYGNPKYYAAIKRDDCEIIALLHQPGFPGPTATNSSLVFYSSDIDTLYNEFVTAGVAIDEPIDDKEYMMREFRIKDPNGYLIVFQQPIVKK